MIEAREVFLGGERRNDGPSIEAVWFSAITFVYAY